MRKKIIIIFSLILLCSGLAVTLLDRRHITQQIKHLVNAYFSNQITVTTIDYSIPEKPIVIITPSYNNRPWYKKNLNSIFKQRYSNYRVIYIDDASTDGTSDLVEAYLKEHNKTDKVTLIRNERWLGGMSNLINGVLQCVNHEIIVICDGDDWFAHDEVLPLINTVYSHNDVWATYGQYIEWPSGNTGCCGPVRWHNVLRNRFREQGWVFSHLRTCYAWLLKKVHLSSLMYKGVTFLAPNDCYMPAVVEMAGTHARFISNILYVLNREPRPPQDRTCSSLSMPPADYFLNAHKYEPLLMPEDTKKEELSSEAVIGSIIVGETPSLKSKLVAALREFSKPYVALAFDYQHLPAQQKLSSYVQELERTKAFCFLPSLHEQSFENWHELSFSPQTKNPCRKQVALLGNGTIAVQCMYATQLLTHPELLNSIILRKKDALAVIEFQKFSHPTELKEIIANYLIHKNELGLFYS